MLLLQWQHSWYGTLMKTVIYLQIYLQNKVPQHNWVVAFSV